jgi:hypothetical protein
MRALAAALCAWSMMAWAQEDPLASFPLQVGSRWRYEHEWKSGDRNRPDVDRWTSEETISGWANIPEGVVILRDALQRINPDAQSVTQRIVDLNGDVRLVRQSGSGNGARLAALAKYPYLIHGNCVYLISDGWDAQKQDLRAEYRNSLQEGSVAPELCFPLLTGREWGNTDIPWRVEPARPGVSTVPPAQYKDAVHIFSSHYGSGGWEDIWFQAGVGIVAEHYIHNGTYDEYTKKLVSFSRP